MQQFMEVDHCDRRLVSINFAVSSSCDLCDLLVRRVHSGQLCTTVVSSEIQSMLDEPEVSALWFQGIVLT